MANLWLGLMPWLAIASLGALHGLSPANGWMFAAACGLRAGNGSAVQWALLPMCLAGSPVRAITASGSLLLALALAAVAVHLAAMLITTGAVAAGVYRSITVRLRLVKIAELRHTWTAALVVAGAVLVVF